VTPEERAERLVRVGGHGVLIDRFSFTATCHGGEHDARLLRAAIAREIREAVQAERDRCARICEQAAEDLDVAMCEDGDPSIPHRAAACEWLAGRIRSPEEP
jgi:hypothetical protein